MNLLHHGVDHSVIALSLGHDSIETTSVYLQADMQLKEQALARTDAADVQTRRYRPDDQLMAFLRPSNRFQFRPPFRVQSRPLIGRWPGLIPVMHSRDLRPQRSAFGVARSAARGRFLWMTGVSSRGGQSVLAEAARRDDCLEFAQVGIADRWQSLRGRAVLTAVRQVFPPGRVLSLRLHKAGGVAGLQRRARPR
jgi:hypothetical protein